MSNVQHITGHIIIMCVCVCVRPQSQLHINTGKIATVCFSAYTLKEVQRVVVKNARHLFCYSSFNFDLNKLCNALSAWPYFTIATALRQGYTEGIERWSKF